MTSKGTLLPPPTSGVIRPLNPPPNKQQAAGATASKDDWGDFASFGDKSNSDSGGSGGAGEGGNWVQF